MFKGICQTVFFPLRHLFFSIIQNIEFRCRDLYQFFSLYNALNGTNYGMEDGLKIVTLEDAIYLTMKTVCEKDGLYAFSRFFFFSS